jgi:type IV pilus assembly protein PilB
MTRQAQSCVLIDMGVAPYMVASSIVGVVAQRLVKVLCQECAEQVTIDDPADLKLVAKTEPITIKAAKHGGCKNCRNTGYAGRSAIHEIIIPSNAIKECISKDGTAEEIGQLAKQNGTKLLRDNVTDMVLNGTTTMDELVKATYTV